MKRILFGAAFALIGLCSWAQSDEQRVYKADKVTFFGVDFSYLKLIHSDGFVDKNGKPMCNTLTFKYFSEWNEMFLIERKKYNITRYFGIPEYTIDQATVTERNKAYAFVENCITENESYRVSSTDMTDAVKLYGSKDASGLGLVIFAESFNKTAGICVLHVVFFDLATHAIVKSERVEGPPVGMGFRNYWANAIDNTLDRSSNEYAKGRKGK